MLKRGKPLTSELYTFLLKRSGRHLTVYEDSLGLVQYCAVVWVGIRKEEVSRKIFSK